MGAVDRAASHIQRRHHHVVHAEPLHSVHRADDVDDRVEGADFVEMDTVERHVVDGGLRFGQPLEQVDRAILPRRRQSRPPDRGADLGEACGGGAHRGPWPPRRSGGRPVANADGCVDACDGRRDLRVGVSRSHAVRRLPRQPSRGTWSPTRRREAPARRRFPHTRWPGCRARRAARAGGARDRSARPAPCLRTLRRSNRSTPSVPTTRTPFRACCNSARPPRSRDRPRRCPSTRRPRPGGG